MSTFCETVTTGRGINFVLMPKTDEKQIGIPAAPLLKRIGKSRGATAAFAKKLQIDHGRVSNWKKRGIPWAQLPRVAEALELTPDQYLAEAGLLKPRARQPSMQYTLEGANFLEDFNALPEWLKEHIARKTAELRNYADSLPAYVREGMRGPPQDPQSYAAWEKNIVVDIEARKLRAEEPPSEPRTTKPKR